MKELGALRKLPSKCGGVCCMPDIQQWTSMPAEKIMLQMVGERERLHPLPPPLVLLTGLVIK